MNERIVVKAKLTNKTALINFMRTRGFTVIDSTSGEEAIVRLPDFAVVAHDPVWTTPPTIDSNGNMTQPPAWDSKLHVTIIATQEQLDILSVGSLSISTQIQRGVMGW